jgi:hypothetical protein
MMMPTMKSLFLLTALLASSSHAFAPATSSTRGSMVVTRLANEESAQTTNVADSNNARRSLLLNSAAALSFLSLTTFANPAFADIPMIQTDEFETILRDSGRSIQMVEFAGTAGDTVTVRLVDGTLFGIAGVIESPSDPRSPLKLAAMCRQYKVPAKFLALESALAGTPKKKKVYMNSIVQTAAEKEVLKRERMRQDEEARLAALYKMEEDEAKKKLGGN